MSSLALLQISFGLAAVILHVLPHVYLLERTEKSCGTIIIVVIIEIKVATKSTAQWKQVRTSNHCIQ